MKTLTPPLPDPSYTLEVSPQNVVEWLKLSADERPRLLDCREQDELGICQIGGNEWIPLGLFSGMREQLLIGNERGVVIYCHHGIRSLRATEFLRAIGVENAFSMSGGIDLWAQLIEPTMQRY